MSIKATPELSYRFSRKKLHASFFRALLLTFSEKCNLKPNDFYWKKALGLNIFLSSFFLSASILPIKMTKTTSWFLYYLWVHDHEIHYPFSYGYFWKTLIILDIRVIRGKFISWILLIYQFTDMFCFNVYKSFTFDKKIILIHVFNDVRFSSSFRYSHKVYVLVYKQLIVFLFYFR